MNIKRFTSLSLLLSLILMVTSSFALYVAPSNKIARALDWHFLGFHKFFWTICHINIGIVFVIFLVIHVYLNWAAILCYLKNKENKLIVFTKEFTAAYLLIVFILIASYFNLPPLTYIYDLQEFIQSKRMEASDK